MKILLHICCAPCTIYPLRILREEGDEVSGLYYNPNIHPYLEYRRRWETLELYADREGLTVIREEAYPLEAFLRQVAFREEERCRSLLRTAAEKDGAACRTGRVRCLYDHPFVQPLPKARSDPQRGGGGGPGAGHGLSLSGLSRRLVGRGSDFEGARDVPAALLRMHLQ